MKPKTHQAAPSRVASIDEFCAAHRISRAFFNKMVRTGDAPDVIRLGRRVLIADDAAAAWRDRHTVRATAGPVRRIKSA